MKIWIQGSDERYNELVKILPDGVDIHHNHPLSGNDLYDLYFDLELDEDPERIVQYQSLAGILVVSAVKMSLSEMIQFNDGDLNTKMIGLNCLPGMLKKNAIEMSALPFEEDAKALVDKLSKDLGWECKLVADRVGMVTPRIICMIINEACYTLQEGTAEKEDIDQSMRLGTNYPHGPFAWANKIGIQNVYEVLAALQEDTQMPRYKICPLLKTHYLNDQAF